MAWTRRRRIHELPALRRAVDDPDAFTELYNSLAERVLVFFTRRVLDGQLALDLTGETFAVSFQERGRFRGTTVEEQEAWVFAIARTRLSRYWRRGRVEKTALRRLASRCRSRTTRSSSGSRSSPASAGCAAASRRSCDA